MYTVAMLNRHLQILPVLRSMAAAHQRRRWWLPGLLALTLVLMLAIGAPALTISSCQMFEGASLPRTLPVEPDAPSQPGFGEHQSQVCAPDQSQGDLTAVQAVYPMVLLIWTTAIGLWLLYVGLIAYSGGAPLWTVVPQPPPPRA
ncbi:MAG: hypothetical protein KatS3mg057_3251 [Herpetosiphonaceae bacterium]|nr:MAG: hypothetical protein KatS3mg057_3251 [Herpetosiphonaceae bacterium]